MKLIKQLSFIGLFALIVASAFIYSGRYPIGADVPHYPFVYWVLEQTREQSVAYAAADIEVPALDAPELLLSGGADYNDMCSGCHLKPGKKQSDMSLGLYPKPPNLSLLDHGEAHQHDNDIDNNDLLAKQIIAKQQFWIIKHGIKASGMPAWGITHDDQRIWAMVAFLQRLPELTPEQYQILTARE